MGQTWNSANVMKQISLQSGQPGLMHTELYVTMKLINSAISPHTYSKFTSFQNKDNSIPSETSFQSHKKKTHMA